MNIDWSRAPDWANWWACDANGEAFWYEKRPRQIGPYWTVEGLTTHAETVCFAGHLPPPLDWRQECYPRPVEEDRAVSHIENLEQAVSNAEKELEVLQERLDGLRQQLADATCPYKVGDKAIIRGYVHRGKTCIITRVAGIRDGRWQGRWLVCGTVLLKNGEPGKQTVSWTEHYERRK